MYSDESLDLYNRVGKLVRKSWVRVLKLLRSLTYLDYNLVKYDRGKKVRPISEDLKSRCAKFEIEPSIINLLAFSFDCVLRAHDACLSLNRALIHFILRVIDTGPTDEKVTAHCFSLDGFVANEPSLVSLERTMRCVVCWFCSADHSAMTFG